MAFTRGITATTATGLAGIAVVALLLTGCAPAAAPSQSVSKGCSVLKAGVKDTMTDLNSSLSTLSSDPQAAADAVTTLTASFKKSAAKVENKKVLKVANGATKALGAFAVQIHAYADDPASADQDKVSSSATDVQTAMTNLGKVCP